MSTPEPILITGASGQLGAYLLHEARRQQQPVIAWSGVRTAASAGGTLPVDLTDHQQTTAAFERAAPTVVIHAAALASVADCQRRPALAREVNVVGTARLAQLAAAAGIRLVLVSTDLVFDGTKGDYREDDTPTPLSEYGRTKRAAELAVLAYPHHAVVRVSLLFGPSLTGRPSFFEQQRLALQGGQPLRLFADEWRTPLDLRSAAQGLLALAATDFAGVIHCGGPERMSRLEMGQRLARQLGHDPAALVPARREQIPAPEPRPRDVSLDSARWRRLFPAPPPNYEAALAAMLAESAGSEGGILANRDPA